PLNKNGRLIVLRVAECEPRGLLHTIAHWDLVPVRGRDDLLADVVSAAVLPDGERRRIDSVRAYWREARPLIHDAIKPMTSFTGREDLLLGIDGALWSGRAAAVTQPATPTGMGGIGKSTLAREYAWQAKEGYAGVWWLHAEKAKDSGTWDGIEHGLVALGD